MLFLLQFGVAMNKSLVSESLRVANYVLLIDLIISLYKYFMFVSSLVQR
jgi:hypothetical protein